MADLGRACSLIAACSASIAAAREEGKPVFGGQFADRFLPMPIIKPMTSDTWGTDAVKPRDISNGIESMEWSYWGGNVLKGDDGRYHLFVCRWREDDPKGHNAWRGSLMVRAVSDNLLGPYTVAQKIDRGHNPEIIRLRNGPYRLYRNGSPLVSDTIDGEYRNGSRDYDQRGRTFNPGSSNYTFTMREDGAVLNCTQRGAIFVSRDGLDTYRRLTTGSVYPTDEKGKWLGSFEDPVIWKDNVQYHLTVNAWRQRQAYHLRSRDGVNWKRDPGFAYTIDFAVREDGTRERWYKYERAKVYQDEHRRAVMMNFAVLDVPKDKDLGGDGHSSKNIMMPLTVERLLTVLDPSGIAADTREIRVKVQAERGFNPHTDMDLTTLRFGAPEVVDFGGGCKLLRSEKAGRDLVLVFDAGGNGFEEHNFAGKLLGRTNRDELLVGYSRLPWVVYEAPMLSAEVAGAEGETIRVELSNFGGSASKEGKVAVDVVDSAGEVLFAGAMPVKPLRSFGSTTVSFEDTGVRPGKQYRCRMTTSAPGGHSEVYTQAVSANLEVTQVKPRDGDKTLDFVVGNLGELASPPADLKILLGYDKRTKESLAAIEGKIPALAPGEKHSFSCPIDARLERGKRYNVGRAREAECITSDGQKLRSSVLWHVYVPR